MATSTADPAPLARAAIRRHHPRQEPSAVVPHAGICAGGGWQQPSLPQPGGIGGSVRAEVKNDLLCRAFTADWASRGLRQEVTFMVHDVTAVGLDGLQVEFDDERVVSDSGIALVPTLAGRLGV